MPKPTATAPVNSNSTPNMALVADIPFRPPSTSLATLVGIASLPAPPIAAKATAARMATEPAPSPRVASTAANADDKVKPR
jgi:hypothetical protein